MNAVERVFIKDLKWLFREQTVSDFGIDAQAEVSIDGEPTGQLIALQIKGGTSFFSRKHKDGFIYHGELRHLEYWDRHSLPVFLVIHNPEDGSTLWQRIERRICKVTDKGWSIIVPAENVLESRSAYHLANGLVNDEEARLRFAFALDAQFMSKFKGQTVRMIWQDWINKGLGLRYPAFEFADGETVKFENWYPTHDVFEAMSRIFPWLQYVYAAEIREESGEVEFHTLDVELRPAAVAYLESEDFFREGIPDNRPEPPESESDYDEYEEWSQGDYSELQETPWNDRDDI